MKPQDIIFILALTGLLWKRNPKYLVAAGLTSLVIAMPLFHFWIFFTAERLVMYAAGFLFAALVLFLFAQRK